MAFNNSQAFFDATGSPNRTPGRKRGADSNQPIIELDKKKQRLQQTVMDNYLSSNTFGNLPDNDEGHQSPIKTLNNGNKSKLIKPPPIIIHTQLKNPKETYKQIQSWAKKPIYFTLSNNLRHVHTTDKSDFYAIRQKFDEIKFEYQTHTPKDEIPKKLILKGLGDDYTADEIKDDLKSQLDSVIDVKQLQKTSQTGEKTPLNIFMVYFSYETRLSVAIKVLRYCCLHKIKLEYFRRNGQRKFTQCFNCQSFGHESRNCTLKFKCVKCVEHHEPGKCSKKKEDGNAVCVNCNGNHPANYRGCPKAKEYIIKKKVVTHKREHTTPHAARTRTNTFSYRAARTPQTQTTRRTLSYADQVKQDSRTVKMNNQQPSYGGMSGVVAATHSGPAMVSDSVFMHAGSSRNFSFIAGEIDSLFGMSMTDLMRSINTFVPKYRLCTDLGLKRMMLIEFMLNFAN